MMARNTHTHTHTPTSKQDGVAQRSDAEKGEVSGRRLTWVPGTRGEKKLDEASRKILKAGRRRT